ncbi:MAG: GNAT family N-acetyltransferase [Candidatus Rokuibacteriota bacterium]|nr:MAG: GNAT family N-acetyltransferase [Candidatus Rokubacteria bacterium]
MTAYRVRLAAPADAEAICRIYNQGIEDRVATLETELRTPEERRQWLSARSPRHPVIVAEFVVAGTVVAGTVSPALIEGGLRETPPGSASADTRSARSGLIAWASLNVFNAREAYRHVADISVYVEREWRGKGAGRVLLEKLDDLGRQHGFHKLVLSAFPFNTGGMALYERLGYRTVGIYREQGRLDGKWVDTIVMEKLL